VCSRVLGAAAAIGKCCIAEKKVKTETICCIAENRMADGARLFRYSMLHRNYKVAFLSLSSTMCCIIDAGTRLRRSLIMDYVGFFTSINPVILGILAMVLAAGAYSSWVSH
jgi:hypothetical protein